MCSLIVRMLRWCALLCVLLFFAPAFSPVTINFAKEKKGGSSVGSDGSFTHRKSEGCGGKRETTYFPCTLIPTAIALGLGGCLLIFPQLSLKPMSIRRR